MSKKIFMRGRWMRALGVTVVIVLILGAGAVAIVRYKYKQNLKPVAVSQRSITVTIPTGYVVPQISKLLKQKGLIRSEWAFKQYVRNTQADNDIKAGTYDLSPSYSVSEIVSIITEGKIKTNLITILPGKRLDETRKNLINSGFSQASVDEALNPDLYKEHPALVDKPAGASLEGYLYPESFQKTDNTTPKQIITLSLDEMQKRLTPEIRAAIAGQGLSVYQGITLASIAEQEANNATDRAMVAQVFYSRIKNGMNLQSDVTAFYGAQIAGKPLSVNFDSLYNTYLHAGLPPGPISNVSASSLRAVAFPAATSYLYFVAGDDGTVHFSSTAEEHQAQVQQYCKKGCAQP